MTKFIHDPSEKILLLLMPYWTPVVPPAGLACLKGYLKQNGYHTKAVDGNVDLDLRELYDGYFACLKEMIPEEKQSVFRNIGNDVWQNHMMAHINYTDEGRYFELVKLLVHHIFFCPVTDEQVVALTHIIDQTFKRLEKYVIDLMEREKPALVGMTVYIGNIPASLFAFRLIRKLYPNVKTVMGGGVFEGLMALDSENMHYFLERTEDCIDKLVVGESEVLFLKLLRGEFPDSQRVISTRDLRGEVVDLNSMGLPDMSDFKLEYYPYMTAFASRSCPFQCSFCSDPVAWGKFRVKNPAQVADELISGYKKYGTQVYMMSDLLMNPFATKLSKELIKMDTSVYWDSHCRVSREVCDPEKAMLWRQAGLYRVQLGTESGSQRILDIMNKKITVEQTKAALKSLASAGIKTTTYWLIGHPGETEEDFQMTLDLIEEMKNYIWEAETNPFWFTPEGQIDSPKWDKRSRLLYPEWAKEMLILQQWIVDDPPNREERYRRVNRFAQHCKRLGIPNPYSTHDIHLADQRWQRLHKNAVPPLERFKEKVYIDDNKRVHQFIPVSNTIQHDGSWGF